MLPFEQPFHGYKLFVLAVKPRVEVVAPLGRTITLDGCDFVLREG
jgi:hypothetical protein